MGHGADLAGWPFAVEERAEGAVVVLVAELGAGIPEFLGVGLVGHVVEHPDDLAVLDFVEQLSAKLEVVALLVDGVRAAADDVNALVHALDHIDHAAFLGAGL